MKKQKVVEEELKVTNFIKIIVILLVILGIFTGVTYLVTNKGKTKTNQESNIQYTKILVGSILNRSEDEYYVLVEKEDDNVTTYESLINTYSQKETHFRFYKVDLTDSFNSKYNSEESKINVDDINDIRFSKTTLLHVKNAKIVSYRQGNDIETYLNNLSA